MARVHGARTPDPDSVREPLFSNPHSERDRLATGRCHGSGVQHTNSCVRGNLYLHLNVRPRRSQDGGALKISTICMGEQGGTHNSWWFSVKNRVCVSGKVRSFPAGDTELGGEPLFPLAFGGSFAQKDDSHVRLLQWNAWTWCGHRRPRTGLHPLFPAFPSPLGGNLRPQRKATRMITTGIIIGSLWMAAGLIFTLGLARSASRQMPHPLSQLRGAMSGRKPKWTRRVVELGCCHRHHPHSMMPLVGTLRFGQSHVASMPAPRRLRRSPSAEPEI